VRSCGLPTKRARARRYRSAGGAEESERDEYGIGGLLYKANRRIIGTPLCYVNGDVAGCLGPGSTRFQPAAAGEGCLENFSRRWCCHRFELPRLAEVLEA